MSDDTMRAAIADSIDEFLARKGGGIRLAYIFAVDVIDSEGNSVRYLGSPNDQELYRSLGLNEYLRKYLELKVADEIGASQGGCECDEREDD